MMMTNKINATATGCTHVSRVDQHARNAHALAARLSKRKKNVLAAADHLLFPKPKTNTTSLFQTPIGQGGDFKQQVARAFF
jgi:hypothetical protein